MPNYPAAILLDLDDTLISFDGVSRQAWDEKSEDFILRHQPRFSKDELVRAIRFASKWYWGDPKRHKVGRENIRQARRVVVALALAGLGVSDPETVHGLADGYSDRHDALIHLFPNTHSTLDALKSSGVRLALITNGSAAGQREKLTRFKLTGYFEHILIDQELGFGKPGVRVYQHALTLMGLNSGDCWMVGDNLVWDIQPPQSIGIHAVWHDWKKTGLKPGSEIVPDRIIQDIGELVLPPT